MEMMAGRADNAAASGVYGLGRSLRSGGSQPPVLDVGTEMVGTEMVGAEMVGTEMVGRASNAAASGVYGLGRSLRSGG
ncbi:MAG TPA: hypothetical protein DCL15_01680, partial [Chloroflexi bacterium]|nr:hypothetical protein [Chloroflexota bacterium]